MGIKVRHAQRPPVCLPGEDAHAHESAEHLVKSIPPGPNHGVELLRLIERNPALQRSLLEVAAPKIDNKEFNWVQGNLYAKARTSAVFNQKPSVSSIDVRSGNKLSAKYSRPIASPSEEQAGPHHAMPEDGSLVTQVVHLGISNDPKHLREEIELVREVLQVAAIEGFRVSVHFPGDPKRLRAAIESKLRPFLTILKNDGSEWLEDGGEFFADGSIGTPAVQNKDAEQLGNQVNDLRNQRGVSGLPDAIGAVSGNKQQDAFRDLSRNSRRPHAEFQTYAEGGNHLVGLSPDGEPYVVVGIDTIEYSQDELGRRRGVSPYLPWDKTVGTFAADLGVKPENVHVVEQPGDFHADMRMALFGNKTVLINDSRRAFELEAQWMRDDFASGRVPGGSFYLERLQSKIDEAQRDAEHQAPLEDAAAADLAAAGFSVHRVAGVFNHLEQRSSFLNMESGTNARGETFAITAGGDPRAQASFLNQIKALSVGLDHIHFLAPNIARLLTDNMGGANCRMKSEGRLPKRS